MGEIPESKNHFVREAKLMFFIPVFILLFGILAGLIIPMIMKQAEIDRCLDRGGKFDYNSHQCVWQESIGQAKH